MKNLVSYLIAVIAVSVLMTSCDKKLDIVPKGMSTLDKLSDLEQLLNQEYEIGTKGAFADIAYISNDGYPAYKTVPGILAAPNTLDYIYLTFDESLDRIPLSETDNRYDNIYQWIYYSNVVISKASTATGDEATRKRIIAEAKIKRAFFHYMAVNIYASQYDESTAADKGGVPYVDYVDMSTVKVKNTIAEVYEKIIEDCDTKVIEDLPDYVESVCRADKAFGFAVRAKILMQMKRYSEAAECAAKALVYNNNLEDRSTLVTTHSWKLSRDSKNFYLYVRSGATVCLNSTCMSKETTAVFPADNFVRKYDLNCWNDSEDLYGFKGGLVYKSFSVMANNMGINTEDMYYVLGECNIRLGKVDDGLSYLDKVQALRIENYKPLKGTSMSVANAMKALQDAKRIEFYGGYNNFFDLKRWNTEPDYRTTITRDLGENGTYTLSPDSPLWIMPFPSSATRYNETLTQNY